MLISMAARCTIMAEYVAEAASRQAAVPEPPVEREIFTLTDLDDIEVGMTVTLRRESDHEWVALVPRRNREGDDEK